MVSSYSTEVNKTMFVFFHLKVSEQLKTGIIFWLWNIFNCFPIFIPRLACKKLFYRSQLFYSFFLMKSPDFILLYSRISSIKEKFCNIQLLSTFVFLFLLFYNLNVPSSFYSWLPFFQGFFSSHFPLPLCQ